MLQLKRENLTLMAHNIENSVKNTWQYSLQSALYKLNSLSIKVQFEYMHTYRMQPSCTNESSIGDSLLGLEQVYLGMADMLKAAVIKSRLNHTCFNKSCLIAQKQICLSQTNTFSTTVPGKSHYVTTDISGTQTMEEALQNTCGLILGRHSHDVIPCTSNHYHHDRTHSVHCLLSTSIPSDPGK
jgi:hypothetical protein